MSNAPSPCDSRSAWLLHLAAPRGSATPAVVASLVAVVSCAGNIWQFSETQALDEQRQALEQSLAVSDVRDDVYEFKNMAINELVTKIDSVSAQAQESLADLSSQGALSIRRACEALDVQRNASLTEISERERNFQSEFDPDYPLTPQETLGRLGRPDCWESVRAIVADAVSRMRNDSDPRLEELLRFVEQLDPQWVEAETTVSANLRDEPSRAGAVVGSVAPGTPVSVLTNEKGQAWSLVRDEETGREGWLWNALLSSSQNSVIAPE